MTALRETPMRTTVLVLSVITLLAACDAQFQRGLFLGLDAHRARGDIDLRYPRGARTVDPARGQVTLVQEINAKVKTTW